MVRVKHRYLLFQMDWEKGKSVFVSSKDLSQKILAQVVEDFGDFGRGCVGRGWIAYWNPKTGIGLFKAPREAAQMVWSSLVLITALDSIPVTIRVVHLGGTIKQCQRVAVKYDAKMLLTAVDETDVED